MRRSHLLNDDWIFEYKDGTREKVSIPHTWNHQDGQDGGNDYYRGKCIYYKEFAAPEHEKNERVYLEFAGVNASARVVLNKEEVMIHHGGYSTFRRDVTKWLKPVNRLMVEVDNSVNDTVYPQKADFTFYGGIYRDVRLIVVNEYHFDMDYYAGPGIAVTSEVLGENGKVSVKTWNNCEKATTKITILDAEGNSVVTGVGNDTELNISKVHLWDGIFDPYLYTCRAELVVDGMVTDMITIPFGVRSFYIDSKKGFFLNGRSYPLRGVCRHQDYKGIGNALSKEHHAKDMELIAEIGANTVRLAHYQHDRYVYDLCDRYGMIVWVEIPYISEHMPRGRGNTESQMKELIVQNYNHPCIMTWGISNEITISTKDKADMLENHYMLNELVHEMDPHRPTSLACYAVCSPFNKIAHITDLVSWNLYLGWYVPGLFLNDVWVDLFHKIFPKRPLGYSEYGCEAMTNLHSSKPRRGDHTEEYQAIYHEYLARFIEKRPFLWATYVWNMFDFAADARNQGGESGMNHKGLVTFDRRIKKDSFYLYKAYWSREPFVHICGSRYVDRPETITEVKVYSNCGSVTLYANGIKVETVNSDKVFRFRLPLRGEVNLEAISGEYKDTAFIRYVKEPNPAYRLKKGEGKGENWV